MLNLPGSLCGQWTSGSGGTIYHNGGNAGIGTASPSFGLEVVPLGYNDGIQVKDPSGTVFGGFFTEYVPHERRLRWDCDNQPRLLHIAGGSNPGLSIENTSTNGKRLPFFQPMAPPGWESSTIPPANVRESMPTATSESGLLLLSKSYRSTALYRLRKYS